MNNEDDLNSEFNLSVGHDFIMNFEEVLLIDSSTVEGIYSMMLSTFKWRIPKTVTLLKLFQYIHNNFALIMMKFKLNDKFPLPELISLYFKMRHNFFSSLLKNSLGVSDLMDTDVDLTEYQINKTPDMMYEFNNEMVIIEFSVSKKRAVIDHNKGGRINPMKYTDISNHLTKITGKKHYVCLNSLALEDASMDILKGDISFLFNGSTSLDEYLNDVKIFQSMCVFKSDIIYDFAYNSNVIGYKPNQHIVDGSREYKKFFEGSEENVDLVYKQINTTIMFELNEKNEFIKNKLKHFILKKCDQCCLVFDVYKSKFFVISSDHYNGVRVRKEFQTKPRNLLIKVELKDNNKIYESCLFFHDNKISRDYKCTLNTGSIFEKEKDNFAAELRENELNKWSGSDIDIGINLQIPVTDIRPIKVEGYPESYESQRESKLEKNDSICDSGYINRLVDMDYESKLDQDIKKDLLVNNNVSMDQIVESIEEYTDVVDQKFQKVNDIRAKNTFIYPLMTGDLIYSCAKINDDDKFLHSLNEKTRKEFAGLFLSFVMSGKNSNQRINRDEKTMDSYKEMNKSGHNLYSKYKELNPEMSMNRIPKIKEIEISGGDNKDISELLSVLKKNKEAYRSNLLTCKKVCVDSVRINMSKRSNSRELFEKEMKHFRYNKSNYQGLDKQTNDCESINAYFRGLISRLMSSSHGKTMTNVRSKGLGPDTDFMKKSKADYSDGYDEIEQDFRNSRLAHWAEFVGRFCYTLLKFSTNNMSGDYFSYSKLSYENCLLIVKGGKKSIKTGKSRLFKLIYPIDEEDIYYGGFVLNDNYKVVQIEGRKYIITPWSIIHEDVMESGLSLYSRIFIYTSVFLKREEKSFKDYEPNMLFPILLCMNNRRKIEETLHNMRYIIVNLLGQWSNIKKILPGMALSPYSFFEVWVNNCIINNYLDFSKEIFQMKTNYNKKSSPENMLRDVELKHLFIKGRISSTNGLTELVYSTYLMTKSPAGKALDQVNNLKKVLQDVDYFNKNHKKENTENDVDSFSFDVTNFKMSDLKDDFMFDPKYCHYLGKVMKAYLQNKLKKLDLSNKWESIMSMPLDALTNSSGLRGRNPEDFFDKKGHEVIYGDLSELPKNRMSSLISEFEKCECEKKKSDLIFEMRYSLSDFCNDNEIDDIIFHIVDKKQRGGGREIYVMDIITKSYQYPLEKFFSFLCKNVDNEFISIPSNSRLNKIHSQFHEKDTGSGMLKSNWVLDKSRWAPHSVTEKYCHFVFGMKGILPESFVDHFFYFFKKMLKKKVYTREYVFKSISENVTFDDLKKHLTKDDLKCRGGYKFEMGFSFMMGIFNFLSSLMHSANQMLASEVIRLNVLKYNKRVINMKMICHSDDSSGVCYYEKDSDLKKALLIYDIHMKAANHKISIKKSQVNLGIYFEFLSILYFGNQLLPLTAKFLPNISFTPTDRGYSSDISIAASKGLECLLTGATMQESYLVTKTLELFIQRFYSVKEVNYDVVYHAMGGIDPHPIQLLLSGMSCEIYKHLNYNRKNTKTIVKILHGLNLIDIKDVTTFGLKWDMGSMVNPSLKKKFEKMNVFTDNYKDSWTVNNVKSTNCFLNTIWFSLKLHETSFYDSLVQESNTRKLLRIMGSYNNRSVVHPTGLIKIKDVCNMIDDELGKNQIVDDRVDKNIDNLTHFFNSTCSELKSFQDCTQDYDLSKMEIHRNSRHCKPTTVISRGSKIGNTIKMPINYATVYTHEPEMIGYLGEKKDYSLDVKKLNLSVESMGFNPKEMSPNDYSSIINMIVGKECRSFKFLSYYSSDNGSQRNINSVVDMFHFFRQSSFFGKELVGKTKMLESKVNYHYFEKNKVPSAVLEILKLKWICCVFNENPMLKKEESLKRNPFDEMKSMMLEIPYDWKLFIDSMFHEGDTNFSNVKFWHCWNVKQLKVINKWIGPGELFVCFPETTIKVIVFDSEITSIMVSPDLVGEFLLKSSSWYMESCVVPELQNLFPFIDPDTIPDGVLCFGYSYLEDSWGVNYPNKFDKIISAVELSEQKDPDWYTETVVLEETTRGSKFVFDETNYELIFASSKIMRSAVSLKDYVDFAKLKMTCKVGEMNETIRSIAFKIGDEVRFDFFSLVNNLSSTRFYDVLFSHYDSCCRNTIQPSLEGRNLMNSLFHFKAINPSFEMLNMSDLRNASNSSRKLDIPEEMIKSNVYLQRSLISQELSHKMAEEVRNIFKMRNSIGEEAFFNMVRSFNSQFGKSQSGGILVAEVMKNNIVMMNCGMITNFCKNKSHFKSIIVEFISSLENVFCKYYRTNNGAMQMMNNIGSHKKTSLFFRMYISEVVFSIIFCRRGHHKGNLFCQSFLKIYDEFLNDKSFINDLEQSFSDKPFLKTVSFFELENTTHLNWVSDMLGSLCSYNNGVRLSLREEFDQVRKVCSDDRWWGKQIKPNRSKDLVEFFPSSYPRYFISYNQPNLEGCIPKNFFINNHIEDRINVKEYNIHYEKDPFYAEVEQPIFTHSGKIKELFDLEDEFPEDYEDMMDEYQDLWDSEMPFEAESMTELICNYEKDKCEMIIKNVCSINQIALFKKSSKLIILSDNLLEEIINVPMIRIYFIEKIDESWSDLVKMKLINSCLIVVGFDRSTNLKIPGWKEKNNNLFDMSEKFLCQDLHTTKNGDVLKKSMGNDCFELNEDLLSRDSIVNRLTISNKSVDLEPIVDYNEYRKKIINMFNGPGSMDVDFDCDHEQDEREKEKISRIMKKAFSAPDELEKNEGESCESKNDVHKRLITLFENNMEQYTSLQCLENMNLQSVVNDKFKTDKETLTQLIQSIETRVRLNDTDIIMGNQEITSQIETLLPNCSKKFLKNQFYLRSSTLRHTKTHMRLMKSALSAMNNKTLNEKFLSFELVLQYLINSSNIVDEGFDDTTQWVGMLNKMDEFFLSTEEDELVAAGPPPPKKITDLPLNDEDYFY